MKKRYLTLSLYLFAISAYGQMHFADVAAAVGIEHSYDGVLGGGVSFYDFNGDGLDDLTLATGEGEPLHFYQNEDGQFVKLTPLVPHEGQAKQVLWADIDNDGDADLFVAEYTGQNRLYLNVGDLVFEDITESAGLILNENTTYGACFGDYDRDGWLDLYIGERVPSMSSENRHYLLRNNADPSSAGITFTDVTAFSGTIDTNKIPFCSSFLDYNNDRWPDLYTAHDKYGKLNTLLENNGNPTDGMGTTFTDASQASNADIGIDAMCVNAGDFNNDGRIDIYVTNTPGGSVLLQNLGPLGINGQVKFADVAPFTGVGFYGTGWGSVFLDADLDCDLDLYVSGTLEGTNEIPSAFYENEGNGSFSQPDAGFIGDTTSTYSNAWGDFNNDGFPDIVAQNQSPHFTQLWQNGGGDHHWLKLELEGVLSNRDGVGSLIEVYIGNMYQMRYTQCGSGFLGQNSGTEIVGLGAAEVIDSIVVTWPTGHVDRLFEVNADQKILLVEGSTTNGDISIDPDVELTIVLSPTQELSEEISVEISPSPTSDFLDLYLPKNNTILNWRIFNASGKMMKTGLVAQTKKIDVSNFPSGAYFIIITNASGHLTSKKWIKK